MLLRLIPASVLIATFTGTTLVESTAGASTRDLAGDRSAVGGEPSFLKDLRSSMRVKRSAAQQLAELEAAGGDLSVLDLDPGQRTARAPYPKKPTDQLHLPINKRTGEVSTTGQIIVKLRDDLGARASRLGPADRITSVIGADLSPFDAVLAQYGGTVQQWITNKTDAALRKIELRAEATSGNGQPDFASFMKVDVPAHMLLAAGRALNNLDIVEFVEFDRPLELHQDNQGCNPQNESACNAPGQACPVDPPITGCNPDPGCLAEPDPLCEAGCRDVICCNMVAEILPYCDDTELPLGWDLLCAAYANLICDQTIYDAFGNLPADERYDPCFTDGTGAPNPVFVGVASIISGGCFESHEGHGCNIPGCCFEVCHVDATCCTVAWDAGCVQLAQTPAIAAACVLTPDPGPTPDFKSDVIQGDPNLLEPGLVATNWQTYIVGPPSMSDFQQWPGDSSPGVIFPATSWRGGGYDLSGVRALQTQFANVYQNGIEPRLNGRGIRVGIIEFSAFVNHEDFVLGPGGIPLEQPGVILEPGQTPILIVDSVEHGTATLGITVARDNGIGVTGIAFEAQGYFNPTLSLEEGSRLPNAIISAMEIFEYGDVLSFSIGYPGSGPIITNEAIAALILAATNLGISCFMSAGNDSIPIDEAPFETNGVVVGACYPGGNGPLVGCSQPGVYHYCRLGFSNYQDPDDDEGLGAVHLSGWGTAVCTTGYGDLFLGQNGIDPGNPETNHLRMYTNTFNGTSSAAPVVAGLAAVMQGWAEQIYGSPISPAQLRNVLADNGVTPQCSPNFGPFGQPPYAPCPDQPECNDDEWRHIGTFPDAVACAYAILNGQFVAGNGTQVKVLYGNVIGQPNSFAIRNDDSNYLKIQTQYAAAGTNVDGLSYMAGGPTTDTLAFLQTNATPGEVTGVALVTDGIATSPNVLLGGFLWNFKDNRWDFIGVGFLAPGGGGATLGVNPFNTPNYVSPGGTLSARVWTCGLGFTPPHQVWHDLIQIVAVGPTLPAPGP